MKNESPEPEVWVVDRVTGSLAVLVELTDEEDAAVMEVAANLLGEHAREGAVLVVPLGPVGEPLWAEASRDEETEAALRDEGEARLDRLRERDPGGDVSL